MKNVQNVNLTIGESLNIDTKNQAIETPNLKMENTQLNNTAFSNSANDTITHLFEKNSTQIIESIVNQIDQQLQTGETIKAFLPIKMPFAELGDLNLAFVENNEQVNAVFQADEPVVLQHIQKIITGKN